MPKNMTQIALPPEQQDAIRRAKKAHQRLHPSRIVRHEPLAPGSNSTDITKEINQIAFRTKQADVARTVVMTQLKEGTVALKMALGILEYFPTIEVGKGKSRTRMATDAAWANLTREERYRDKAWKHGTRIARRELSLAFESLIAQR